MLKSKYMKMRTLLAGCALIAAGTLSAVNIEWTFDEAAAVRLPEEAKAVQVGDGAFEGRCVIRTLTGLQDIYTMAPGLLLLFR